MHQVRCVANAYRQAITIGQLYVVLGSLGAWWVVVDDHGESAMIERSMFARS